MIEMNTNAITIDADRISVVFGEMEPIVIPRRTLRTRLQLLEWIYRLTGWPGMTLSRIRHFIAAVFRHHGWGVPEESNLPLLMTEDISRLDSLGVSHGSLK